MRKPSHGGIRVRKGGKEIQGRPARRKGSFFEKREQGPNLKGSSDARVVTGKRTKEREESCAQREEHEKMR